MLARQSDMPPRNALMKMSAPMWDRVKPKKVPAYSVKMN